ncbi:hypothetical protein QTN23_06990 [Pseudomonas shirazica]|uniref:hypothetical protein n=1 Tax=Pseudomonas shirazica TaxID=1940636 RepID=UPI0025AA094B|nr:hypothetical protein [Pseudomonas shirazica]MDM9599232.1 hypothetical protein [Pseudomonas shirazica]MDO2412660.1 hypothetical protein [Pseudomonas shirazica]
MAVVTFGDDPVSEARALQSLLAMWLAEQQTLLPERATPAQAHCKYNEDGNLRTLTIVLDEGD